MTAESLSVITIDEDARRRFEAAWYQERPQAIEDFLPASDQPHYLATLEELVHIELEFGWKAWGPGSGVRPASVESYLARFPCLNQPVLMRRLLEQEYRVRHRFGDRPPLAE
ncbi:MAG TPA: hypothetical protein VKU02_16960 [Gemmataceae bacterium]|nr:hypothetical protein [Gemmataceae bacterium]